MNSNSVFIIMDGNSSLTINGTNGVITLCGDIYKIIETIYSEIFNRFNHTNVIEIPGVVKILSEDNSVVIKWLFNSEEPQVITDLNKIMKLRVFS